MYNPFLKAEISVGIYTGHGGLYRRPFMRFAPTSIKSRSFRAFEVPQSRPLEPLFYSISSISLQFPSIPFDYFRSSPAKKFMSLTTNPKILSPSHIDSVFCDLQSISPEQLIGKWDGFVLGTRHPFEMSSRNSTGSAIPSILLRTLLLFSFPKMEGEFHMKTGDVLR